MDARPRELHLLFRAYKVSSVDCVNNGLEHIAVRAEIFFFGIDCSNFSSYCIFVTVKDSREVYKSVLCFFKN